MQRPAITIITVVYNDRDNISNTIDSVVSQSYDNLEYIVVDGLSNDGTLGIIEANTLKIDLIISEKDKGIYDAMNKGIMAATGEWILFLNAGDTFFSTRTIEDLVEYTADKRINFVYGDVEVFFPEYNIYRIVKAKEIEKIVHTMPMNHQSVLIRTDYHKDNLYNLDFPIASDYDFLLKSHLNNEKFLKINFPVSRILAGGISDTKRNTTFYEMYKIKNQYMPALQNKISYCKNLLQFYVSKSLKLVLPRWIVEKIYLKKYNKNERRL